MEGKERLALFFAGQRGNMVSFVVVGRDYIIQQEYAIRIKALTVLHSSFFCKVSKGWGC